MKNRRDVSARYNLEESQQLDELVQGSYDYFVRLERRNLLLISSLILVTTVLGIEPTKSSLLGLSFENVSIAALNSVLGAIDFYFLCAFVVYAFPMYRAAIEARRKIVSDSGTMTYTRPWYSPHLPNLGHNLRYYFWMFLQFILPVGMGAIACLVSVSNAA